MASPVIAIAPGQTRRWAGDAALGLGAGRTGTDDATGSGPRLRIASFDLAGLQSLASQLVVFFFRDGANL